MNKLIFKVKITFIKKLKILINIKKILIQLKKKILIYPSLNKQILINQKLMKKNIISRIKTIVFIFLIRFKIMLKIMIYIIRTIIILYKFINNKDRRN